MDHGVGAGVDGIPGVGGAAPRSPIDETPNREPSRHTKRIPSMDEYEELKSHQVGVRATSESLLLPLGPHLCVQHLKLNKPSEIRNEHAAMNLCHLHSRIRVYSLNVRVG